MNHEHEIWQLLDKLQMDNRAMAAKLTELRAQVAQINLPTPEQFICPTCGIDMRGKLKLAEHIYHSHNGPLPEHWAAAEAIADEPHEHNA